MTSFVWGVVIPNMKQQEETLPVLGSTETQAWIILQRQCKAFIASGFLPDHITKNCSSEQAMAKALTIAQKGKELGIPPLQAFSSITVIKGKPCLSAELMLALCYQRIANFSAAFITPPEKATQECTIVMKRGHGQPQTFRFTMEDAKNAGLLAPGSAWQKYPAAMLRARVISAACRAVAPDAIMGCYTPEELGGPILEGEIIEAEAQLPAAIKTETKPQPNEIAEDDPIEHFPFEVTNN